MTHVDKEHEASLLAILEDIRRRKREHDQAERRTLELLAYYRGSPEGAASVDDAGSTEKKDEESPGAAVTAPPIKGELIKANGITAVPKARRQRLSRGYASATLLKISRNAERVLHGNEFLDELNEHIRVDYPDQPHLLADGGTIRRALRVLHAEGTFIRVRYGPSANYIFHGRPEFFTKLMGQHAFANERFKPNPALLGRSTKTPRFEVAGLDEIEAATQP